MSSLAFLPLMAADKLIVGILCSIAVRLSKMQHQKLLMLHWHSFWYMVRIVSEAILTKKAADSSIFDQLCRTAP
jgi:hypothetical protein